MRITADDIKFVKILDYNYIQYKVELPTHYNKHDIIINSYKYDIKSHALNFLIYKIRNDELRFMINNEIDEKTLMKYLLSIPHEDAKKIYTKLSGLIVKESREYYDELLKSSIKTMEELIKLNIKMGLTDLKILKVFVDEFIVDKPLLIKNIPNPYLYNFEESKFLMFVKSLDFLKKQLYIFDEKLEIKLDFYYEENLISDIENKILQSPNLYDSIDLITSDLISGRYDSKKLVLSEDNKPIIYYDGLKLPYIESQKFKYDIDYYYKMYKDIVSNIVLAKTY